MYSNTIQLPIPDFLESIKEKLNAIPENIWQVKPAHDKWSKKEILGHLIDSGQNNIRRLIVSQYQQNDKIRYEQNEWVKYNGYQTVSKDELIQLWYLTNKQYHRISTTIPDTSLLHTCDTGKETVSLVTLKFLIEDYWGHQIHHLKQMGIE